MSRLTGRGGAAAGAAGRLAGPTLAVLLLAACLGAEPTGTEEPTLVRSALEPTDSYRAWWAEISACSGITGRFERVRFFEAVAPLYLDGRWFGCGPELFCNGLWESPHDVTLAPAYVHDERLVKHEMLHDLLGAVGHPPVFEACEVDWTGGDPRGRGR